jgi:hypothetical protein
VLNSEIKYLCRLLVILVCVIGLSGCAKKNDSQSVHMTNRTGKPFLAAFYDASRVIVDSVQHDLANDGGVHFIVLSRNAGSTTDPDRKYLFDRMEVFRRDSTTGLYYSLFVDPVENAVAVSFQDITNDGKNEILVSLFTGGNDPVASNGLNVYGYRNDGKFSLLFYATNGNPKIEDIDNDGKTEIINSAEYWGLMSHADAIIFTSGIYSFNGTAFTANNAAFSPYFQAQIKRKKSEYQKAKNSRNPDSEEYSNTLYRSAAEYLLWMDALGNMDQLKTVWDSERPALKTLLLIAQFDEIDSLVNDMLTRTGDKFKNQSPV